MYNTNSLFRRALEENDARYINAIPKVLYNDTEQIWVDFINEFIQRYRQTPSLEVFQEHFHSANLHQVNNDVPTRYIYDQLLPALQTDYLSTKIINDSSAGKTVWTPDYLEALSTEIRPNSLDIIELTKFNTEAFIRDRKLLSFGQSAKWFNEAIGKLDQSDFGLISGRAKSAKTTILSLIAVSMFKEGHTVMIFNNELDKLFFTGRIVSLIKKFNPKVFRTLEYTDDIKEKFLSFEEEMRNYENQLYVYGRLTSPSDIISAYNRADPKPDVILIDAINNAVGRNATNYSEHSISMANLAVFIRDFTLDYRVPIIATSQLNRQAANSTEPGQETMAGSDELVRQVDWAVTTAYTEQDVGRLRGKIKPEYLSKWNGKMPWYKLNTMVNRHGEMSSTFMHIDWDEMRVLYSKENLEPRETLISEEDLDLLDNEEENESTEIS